jgi:hypothetical protein
VKSALPLLLMIADFRMPGRMADPFPCEITS